MKKGQTTPLAAVAEKISMSLIDPLGDTYYVAIINHKKIIAIFSESCFCYNKDGKIS